MPPASLLDAMGVPPATARILTFFARNPTARPTVRELQRTLGIASASAQRDLERLVAAGALRITPDGTMRRYAPVMDFPLWTAIRILLEPCHPERSEGKSPGHRESSLRYPQGGKPSSAVRESAKRYGVDLGQLESALRLTVEERIAQLDANATFLRAATKSRPSQPADRRP